MKEGVVNEGQGLIVQFLHANAYTPGCYDQVWKELAKFEIRLPYQRPLWEETDPGELKHWSLFVDDIIDHMDSLGRKNVIGVGHSMGGVTTLLASIKRPDLFSQIILIDPVILPGFATSIIRKIPFSIKMKYFPFVKIASRRRDHWPSREAARTHFQAKRIFQRFDPAAFDDFIQYGLKEEEGSVTLAFPRAWEARVYGTAPNLWGELTRIQRPTTLIRAEYSDVINDNRWESLQLKMKMTRFVQIDDAGHLFPFEKPATCARLIKQAIQ